MPSPRINVRIIFREQISCLWMLYAVLCWRQTVTVEWRWSMERTQKIWYDFDRASSLICGNKMPTRCSRGFYCRSYCLFNMFRASLCPSSGAQEYYTVVAACGISCCDPANRTHNPQLHTRPTTWKPQHQKPQAATTV